MSDDPPTPPVDDDMEAQEVGTSDELAVTSDSINEPETSGEPELEPEPEAVAEPEPEPEPEAPVEEPEPEPEAPAAEPEAAVEYAAPAPSPEPVPTAVAAAAPAVAPPVPVAAKMPNPRPFTKENIAPASDPSESLFAKKTPVHSYLATHIQVAVRHALRALSAQRPEEPFVMASDVIRKWTPQSAPPRLSRPTGGVGVGAREYLESVGILKVLHDGMCAMAKGTFPKSRRAVYGPSLRIIYGVLATA